MGNPFRYFYFAGNYDETILEDTLEDYEGDEALANADKTHRHYDPQMELVAAGSTYQSAKDIPTARRRKQAQLGVTRSPFIEPIGELRENHYQCRLLFGLAWFSTASGLASRTFFMTSLVFKKHETLAIVLFSVFISS